MFGKKKQKPPSPEHQYEIMREYNRLFEAKDNEGLVKYGTEHFDELSEPRRKEFLLAVYEDMRETVGQAEAEQFVFDRLDSFSEETKDSINDEVWGGVIEAYGLGGTWKTGRKERPEKPRRKRRRSLLDRLIG